MLNLSQAAQPARRPGTQARRPSSYKYRATVPHTQSVSRAQAVIVPEHAVRDLRKHACVRRRWFSAWTCYRDCSLGEPGGKTDMKHLCSPSSMGQCSYNASKLRQRAAWPASPKSPTEDTLNFLPLAPKKTITRGLVGAPSPRIPIHPMHNAKAAWQAVSNTSQPASDQIRKYRILPPHPPPSCPCLYPATAWRSSPPNLQESKRMREINPKETTASATRSLFTVHRSLFTVAR